MAFTCDICEQKVLTVITGENENGIWMHCQSCASVVETDKIGDVEEYPTRQCQECGIETSEYEVVRFQDKTHIVFCSDIDACSERKSKQEAEDGTSD